VVGQIGVQDAYISATEFLGLVVRTLRSRREWQIVENQSRSSPERGSETLSAEGAFGVLDGQLYRKGDRLWLAVQLVNGRSGGLSWSGLYSRPSISPAGHAGH
jgi:TolB-like protein